MRVYIISVIVWGCVLAAARPAREAALPKTVWTYATAARGYNLLEDLCLEKMLGTLAKDRWVLEIITAENYFNYLEDYDRFLRIRNLASPGLSFHDLLPLIRLHVLQRYGGFWVDPATVLLTSLQWIPSLHLLPEIRRFGQEHYEMVLFSRASTEGNTSTAVQLPQNGQNGQLWSGRFTETSLVLALRNSSVLNRWLEEFERRVDHRELMAEAVRSYSQQRFMEVISLKALQSVLTSTSEKTASKQEERIQLSMVTYKIWEFVYLDYGDLFQQYAKNSRAEVAADVYLKYEVAEIQLNFGKPNYLVPLGRVSEIIDAVINPKVSKHHFLNAMPAVEFLNPRGDMDCVRYVLRHSFVDEYLIAPSKMNVNVTGKIRRRSKGMREQCGQAYSRYYWKELGVKIGIAVVGVVGLVVLWFQKIVLRVLGRRLLGVLAGAMGRLLEKWEQVRERMKSSTLLPV